MVDMQCSERCARKGLGVRVSPWAPRKTWLKSRLTRYIYDKINKIWACGGIGIRVRLRCVFRKEWRFKSSQAHFGRLAQR